MPAALAALSAIPLTAAMLRLTQLAGGPAVIPADHRFASFPLPLVVHIVGATAYALAGILQFVPRFRARHLPWHRRAGRVLAVAGLLVAISALWMTLFYQAQPGTGDLLYLLRLVFGSAMAACLVLGFASSMRARRSAYSFARSLPVMTRQSEQRRLMYCQTCSVNSGCARCNS